MSKTDFSLPNVFDYQTTTSYLIDVFHFLKTESKDTLTVRQWAKQLGFQSADPLIEVLKRKRLLKLKHSKIFETALSLSPKQSFYFQTLIQLENATTDDERNYFRSVLEWVAPSPLPKRSVEPTEIFTDWLDGALVEMSKLQRFSLNQKTAVGRFRTTVEETRVQERMQKLENAGLLQRNAHGEWNASENFIATPNDVSHVNVNAYYRQVSALAADSADLPLQDREFQCFSMAIRNQDLPKAKALLRQFRDTLESITCASGAESVYQANFQLFPLTK